ncbi:hypothetical protein N566_16925 [Streptomycetaceae bacterium MP113-05]|nr:hypothetical protein N566_16925 [Streptomycetaceae bacterium MP113-05]
MSRADVLAPDARWFPDGAPGDVAGAGLTLICFPFAGGTASVYRGWQEHLGEDVRVVSVQLPGRGLRLRERPLSAMDPLVEELVAALTRSGLPQRYALFGHSMGALLAYEVACELRRRGEQQPLHFFASGSRAPHLYGDRSDHTLPDEELRKVVTDLGGLGADESIAAAYFRRRLPALRADLRACETYVWSPRPPLECPMTAFSAMDDPLATARQVEEWRAYTSCSFLSRHIPGDHFFLNAGSTRARLLRELRVEIGQFPAPSSAGRALTP